eukprot:XP_019925272.1 PREDICTED: uncharacterized protein LOC109619511 [Crassostrea gigas]
MRARHFLCVLLFGVSIAAVQPRSTPKIQDVRLRDLLNALDKYVTNQKDLQSRGSNGAEDPLEKDVLSTEDENDAERQTVIVGDKELKIMLVYINVRLRDLLNALDKYVTNQKDLQSRGSNGAEDPLEKDVLSTEDENDAERQTVIVGDKELKPNNVHVNEQQANDDDKDRHPRPPVNPPVVGVKKVRSDWSSLNHCCF